MGDNGKILKYEEISRIAAPVFASYDVGRAWLFGSYARGEATEDSDIDLCIEGCSARGMFGLGRLYDDLCKAFNKPVDLVTAEALLHDANRERTKSFRNAIQSDERLIYEK